MPLSDFAERIERLSAAARAQSQTARLAPYFPAIDHALANGVSLQAILDELRHEGFDFQLTGLKSALYRIRKKMAGLPSQATPNVKDTKQAQPSKTADTASPRPTSTTDEPPGIKSVAQLQQENPFMPRLQVTKLYAQQYDRPAISNETFEEMKRKFAAKSKT
jgi:hypothetical protein